MQARTFLAAWIEVEAVDIKSLQNGKVQHVTNPPLLDARRFTCSRTIREVDAPAPEDLERLN